jgi:hypothetical protein
MLKLFDWIKPMTIKLFFLFYFSTKHAALRRKSKYWLAWNQHNVFEWGDKSVCSLLFHPLHHWFGYRDNKYQFNNGLTRSGLKAMIYHTIHYTIDLVIETTNTNFIVSCFTWHFNHRPRQLTSQKSFMCKFCYMFLVIKYKTW